MTADQSADFLRGLGWDVFRGVIKNHKWVADHESLDISIGYLTDAELITLAKEKGAGS